MSEWKKVSSLSDISDLTERVGHFHDSYLVELHYTSPVCASGPRVGVSAVDKPVVRIFLQGIICEFQAIELLFVGAPKVSLADGDTWATDEPIDEAWIYQTEDGIRWTTEDPIHRCSESTDSLSITSKELYWRPVPEWTGSRLRYLDPELEVVQEVDLS